MGSSIPEVEVVKRKKGFVFDVICHDDDHCNGEVVDFSVDVEEAERIKQYHMNWHNEGMPF